MKRGMESWGNWPIALRMCSEYRTISAIAGYAYMNDFSKFSREWSALSVSEKEGECVRNDCGLSKRYGLPGRRQQFWDASDNCRWAHTLYIEYWMGRAETRRIEVPPLYFLWCICNASRTRRVFMVVVWGQCNGPILTPLTAQLSTFSSLPSAIDVVFGRSNGYHLFRVHWISFLYSIYFYSHEVRG